MIDNFALRVRAAFARTFASEIRRASQMIGTLAITFAFVAATA